MRIVVAGVGSRGDMQPLFLLARALAARGHEVTVAGPPVYVGFGSVTARDPAARTRLIVAAAAAAVATIEAGGLRAASSSHRQSKD